MKLLKAKTLHPKKQIFRSSDLNYNHYYEKNNFSENLMLKQLLIIKEETTIFPKLMTPSFDDKRTYNTIDIYEIVPVKS